MSSTLRSSSSTCPRPHSGEVLPGDLLPIGDLLPLPAPAPHLLPTRLLSLPSGGSGTAGEMASNTGAHLGVDAEDIPLLDDTSREGLRRRAVAPNTQQIFVKNLKGRTLTLHVDLLGTIGDVMDMIKKKDGLIADSEVLANEVLITYGGRVLERDFVLAECNIEKDSTLIMVARGRGGRDEKDSPQYQISEEEARKQKVRSHKRKFYQVIDGDVTPGSALEKKKRKLLSTYSLKALLFAIAMFSSYLTNSTSISCNSRDTFFVSAFVLFIIVDAPLLVMLPNYGNAMVYFSWLLLESVVCVLSNLFNGYHAFATPGMLLPLILVVSILQPKLKPAVQKYVLSFYADTDNQQAIDEKEDQHFDHLFDLSQGIANCGGLIAAIMGHFDMVGPTNVVGFFFFSTIALGLYLMMVITVRIVSCPHATCLAIVLMVLLLITVTTASISFVHRSGSQHNL